jgi:hypothetical protein
VTLGRLAEGAIIGVSNTRYHTGRDLWTTTQSSALYVRPPGASGRGRLLDVDGLPAPVNQSEDNAHVAWWRAAAAVYQAAVLAGVGASQAAAAATRPADSQRTQQQPPVPADSQATIKYMTLPQ